MDGMLSQEEINALLGNRIQVLPLPRQVTMPYFPMRKKMRSEKSPIFVGYGGNNAVLTGKPEGCDHNTGC